MTDGQDKEQRQVLEAYRMFANSRGWMRRMEEDIARGLSAEAAVEKEQSAARARMETVPDPYLRERLQDLDDLSNRLLRILTGQGADTGAEMPDNPILVARNIGPAELLDYGRKLQAASCSRKARSARHAAIVARALAIPLVIHAERITTEALNGDQILVDGDQGIVHLRPEETVAAAFRDKIAMQAEAQKRYACLRDMPGDGELRHHHRAAHERGPDGRPALARRLGRRGRGPVPHRTAVPDPHPGAASAPNWPRSMPA